jgi:hypothetical protein
MSEMSAYLDRFPVSPPKVVAIAKQPGLQTQHKFADRDLPGQIPEYGEDFTFGTNRKAPNGEDVGSTESELKPKMWHLLDYFAEDDDTGMARRLFSQFTAKQKQVTYFTDKDLNNAVANHQNFQAFCRRAMSGPYNMAEAPPPGKVRIHQALKAANWDINKLVAPTDLGAPAFNLGSKAPNWGISDATGDWANGLGLMINAVQYVYVLATHYFYSKESNSYFIRLKFMGYDVFGLDDDDVDEYGAQEDDCKFKKCDMGVGITAWWQLQHQHNYPPLITRFVVEKDYGFPVI